MNSAEKKDVLCNLCGLTCMLGSLDAPEGRADHICYAAHGLIDAEVLGGYLSTPGNGEGALDDMSRYKFSLCEFCLDWLFSRCVIPVKVMDFDEEEDFRPAVERVNDEPWRKDKDSFFREYERRARARGAMT